MNVSLNHQLLRLTGVLQLEQRARTLHGPELAFLIVNETMGVLHYQQAALWLPAKPSASRIVLSGVAAADSDSPYRVWVEKLARALARRPDGNAVHAVDPGALPPPLREAWQEWFPEHALWCPLTHPDGRILGGLVLGRADPFNIADVQMMEHVGGQFGQCLAWDGRRRRRSVRLPARLARSALIAALCGLAIYAMTLPVRRSVIASAEVVPLAPAPIRAPFDGVVGAIHVAPNAAVHAGDKLVSLERTQLQAQFDVATKALELARAEYAVNSQQAMNDPKAKARLALLAGKVEQQAAELAYSKGLLDRSELTAPIDGVAVFGTVAEWIGKPVAVGERIMQVAAPTQTELEIEVPAADAVTFDLGAPVTFFSNVSPDTEVQASLDYASYGTAMTADGTMAYTFRARFLEPGQQRLGVKGSAKIYGPKQPLGLWLLRRPLATVRQWLAL